MAKQRPIIDKSAYSRKIRNEYDKIARQLQREGVLDKNWRLTAKGRRMKTSGWSNFAKQES